MRQLLILVKKEFRQIFRNKAILAIIFIVPMIQLLVLPLAANYEIKNINLAVVDSDHSSLSRSLIRDITSSGYFKIVCYNKNFTEAYKVLEKDETDVIIEIPANFEKKLIRQKSQSVFIGINAINGTKAGLSGAYLGSILQKINQKIQLQYSPETQNIIKEAGIGLKTSLWFNKNYNYRLALVPGILVFLVTLVVGTLSSLNIVAEKEVGTIEQINVSPVKKSNFILGKLIPFWILGNIVFTIGLIISVFVYGITMVGSFALLYFFIAIYLLVVLGYGLLISTVSETQQQAMFINFFFIMIFILLSGLFTPIESMPNWAQSFTYFNPLRYMIKITRLIILKNSGFIDLLPEFVKLIIMAVFFNVTAILNYRKTT